MCATEKRKVRDRWLPRENVFVQRVRCHTDQEKVCVDERERHLQRQSDKKGEFEGEKVCERETETVAQRE